MARGAKTGSMDVLVTGSSGVLGQSLVPRPAARGDRLRLFDVVKTPEALGRAVTAAGGTWAGLEGDMRDPQSLARACDGVEVVYHLAAGQRMKPQFASFSEEEIFAMNLGGVRNVLRAPPSRSATDSPSIGWRVSTPCSTPPSRRTKSPARWPSCCATIRWCTNERSAGAIAKRSDA